MGLSESDKFMCAVPQPYAPGEDLHDAVHPEENAIVNSQPFDLMAMSLLSSAASLYFNLCRVSR